MGFSIDIDDSEVRRALDELSDAISANTLLEWANQIENTVRQSCEESVRFKGLIKPDGKFALEISAKANEIDCILNAIRQHLSSMHPATRAFYEKVIEQYEAKRREATQS